MVVWFVAIGPTAREVHDTVLVLVVTFAYPVGDLVVIFAMVVLMLRGTRRDDKTVLGIALCAIGLFVVADLAYAHLSLNTNYQAGSWPDATWMLAQCLLVCAAALQGQRSGSVTSPGSAQRPGESARFSRLPYVAMTVGVGLVAIVAYHTAHYPLNGLIIGTVFLVAVVMVRQLIAQRENVRLLAHTTALASTDTLTGLTNRRTFFERAQAELSLAHYSSQPVSALMIDVDNFKQINDTYGHAAGDLVLHTIGAIGSQHLRGNDHLARYGGDEFVALLPNTTLEAAARIALRFADAVSAETFHLGDTDVTLTLSIGAAHADGCQDLAELIARADNAVYRAKRAGRACVQT
jgi:diguanylate cyclase (GGDEF)-like protein